jgi:hypothetical protein
VSLTRRLVYLAGFLVVVAAFLSQILQGDCPVP